MAQGAAASRRAAEASQTTLASVRQVMRSTLVRWGDGGGVAFYGKDLFYFRKSYNRIIAKLQIFDKRWLDDIFNFECLFLFFAQVVNGLGLW